MWTRISGSDTCADMDFDDEYDASGLLCPLPVLKARKRLLALADGQILRLIATDPAAIVDVPHFCVQTGYELLNMQDDGAAQVYFIRKH